MKIQLFRYGTGVKPTDSLIIPISKKNSGLTKGTRLKFKNQGKIGKIIIH